MSSKSHKGESNPRSRLTEAKVREIRMSIRVVEAMEARGEFIPPEYTMKNIAKVHGVSVVTIYKIKSGERWGHVK
jgi:hypothetical protein